MKLTGNAKLLRIFSGEGDTHHHMALHESIVKEARAAGLAGATVLRGILSFGATARLRSTKILDLSSDLPVITEIVDTESKIEGFLPRIQAIFDETGCGGMVTIESVDVIHYLHKKL
jgi:PII-like signaling protein